MLLTDDPPSDVTDPPFTPIFELLHDRNAQLDNSVVIFTFGLGVKHSTSGLLALEI